MNLKYLLVLMGLVGAFTPGLAQDKPPAPERPALTAGEQSDNACWLAHIDEACQAAKDQNKQVMVNISGLSWSPTCKKLEANVFSQDEFFKQLEDQYVFVRLDTPRRPREVSEERDKEVREAKQKFEARGMSSLLILNPDKTVVARIPLGDLKTDKDGIKAVIGRINEQLDIAKQIEDIKTKAKEGDAQAKTDVEIMDMVEKIKVLKHQPSSREIVPLAEKMFALYKDGKEPTYEPSMSTFYYYAALHLLSREKEMDATKKLDMAEKLMDKVGQYPPQIVDPRDEMMLKHMKDTLAKLQEEAKN